MEQNSRRNYTAATASTVKTAATMNVEKVNMNTAMIQVCTKLVKKEGTTFSEVPQEEAVQEKEIRMEVYHTQVVATRKNRICDSGRY